MDALVAPAAPVLVTTSAIACASVVVAAIGARWVALTPATPNWPLVAGLAVGCLLACVAAAGWALARRRLLVPA